MAAFNQKVIIILCYVIDTIDARSQFRRYVDMSIVESLSFYS